MCQEIPDTFRNMLFWTKTIDINFYFAQDTRIRFFLSETVYTSNYVLIRVLLKIVKIIPAFECMWLSYLLFWFVIKKIQNYIFTLLAENTFSLNSLDQSRNSRNLSYQTVLYIWHKQNSIRDSYEAPLLSLISKCINCQDDPDTCHNWITH